MLNKKKLILRALALRISYLNAASYFKKSNYSFSENPYMKKFFYQEYEIIDSFFEILSKLSSKIELDLSNPFKEKDVKKEIADKAIDLYTYLLKAKSLLPAEVEKIKNL
ncbi:MAG: hypothetical protein K2X90_01495 [Candidatus Babeliaceae bacterium]|nr:hypothetical protein [Candidatus Babeliaceae bacterium]